ncbi:MAG: hypothetical protein IKU19_03210 [Clostridia bacterium]|nr:hypothetical protein [Clostridia bacterium]
MKKVICLILITVLLIPMSVGLFAQENEYTFFIEDEEITITGIYTEEEAYEIAYLHYCMENDIEITTSYAACSHTYEYQEVTATTHRYRADQPRCKKFRYNIGSCTKCVHVTTELLDTWYVFCCD